MRMVDSVNVSGARARSESQKISRLLSLIDSPQLTLWSSAGGRLLGSSPPGVRPEYGRQPRPACCLAIARFGVQVDGARRERARATVLTIMSAVGVSGGGVRRTRVDPRSSSQARKTNRRQNGRRRKSINRRAGQVVN
jgi:hypothetical protein